MGKTKIALWYRVVVYWLCVCDCGKSEPKWVAASSLLHGSSKTCGCIFRAVTKHGVAKRGHCRGGKVTREYQIWLNMVQRCTNPRRKDYAGYGGRGITIEDPRWLSFDNFYADMGESNGLTLERLDNSKGYSKSNCEFRTRKQQQRNTRYNRIVEYQGKSMSLAEAIELSGMKYDPVEKRLRHWHCTFEEALSSPLVIHKNWSDETARKKIEASLEGV
jgi:hypothetical protein